MHSILPYRFILAALLALLLPHGSARAGTLAIFGTSVGDIEVELFDEEKPVTVSNFVHYVESNAYKGLFIERWVPGFVIQAGSQVVANRGQTNAVITNATTFAQITNEYSVGETFSNIAGTIAMVRRGGEVNSAAGFLFLSLKDNSNLDTIDEGFTVFGKVRRGTENLNRFLSVDTVIGSDMRFIFPNPVFDDPDSALPTANTDSPTGLEDLVFTNIELLRLSVVKNPDGTRTITWNSVRDMVNRVVVNSSVSTNGWTTLITTNGNGGDLSHVDTTVYPDDTVFYRLFIDYPNTAVSYVHIGHPGNQPDPVTGNGAVPTAYRIGEFEVSYAEYAAFLNAVNPDGSDPFGLFNTSMSSGNNSGIDFVAGNPAGTKYVVKPGLGNRPVVYVNAYDAMRFCNWLHNGGRNGNDTETGAYTLLGGTPVPSNGSNVVRNVDAKVALPTDAEWYKAAYFQPANRNGDSDNFWLSPYQSNSAFPEPPPGTGSNAGNYENTVGTTTDVGAYKPSGSDSWSGTSDQGGNVFEWVETILGNNARILRGGSFSSAVDDAASTAGPFAGSPVVENQESGFRVVLP